MSELELAPQGENIVNGAFLNSLEPGAASTSQFSSAIDAVASQYIDENQLGFALSLMQARKITVLTDYWKNSALTELVDSAEASGFNDNTSAGKSRTPQHYLGQVTVALGSSVHENPVNIDYRFPGQRLLGFAIGPNDQPVMAIVALDPSKLDPDLSIEKKVALIEEVNVLRSLAAGSDEAVRNAAGAAMSSDLRQTLVACLLANHTIVNTQTADGSIEQWAKPFDVIASLKALYVLLSGEESSGAMRQGAIRMTSPEGQSIIVGGSALNSAIDETVARNFAGDVLAELRGA